MCNFFYIFYLQSRQRYWAYSSSPTTENGIFHKCIKTGNNVGISASLNCQLDHFVVTFTFHVVCHIIQMVSKQTADVLPVLEVRWWGSHKSRPSNCVLIVWKTFMCGDRICKQKQQQYMQQCSTYGHSIWKSTGRRTKNKLVSQGHGVQKNEILDGGQQEKYRALSGIHMQHLSPVLTLYCF